MLIAAAQFEPKPGDFEGNYAKHLKFIDEAASLEARLILFPELSISGYTYDRKILLSSIDFFRQKRNELIYLSRKYNMAIVGGIPRKILLEIRNSVFVVRKKKQILFYDKTHLFRKEKEVFSPGERFLVFKFNGVRFGILVCYEIGFPEISRILTLNGAQVLLAPFAFGRERKHIYDIATRARALENGAYLVTSSTSGKGLMNFLGSSRIVGPDGSVLVSARKKEQLIYYDVSVENLEFFRYIEDGISHAYFLNRKNELYKGLVR
ncbi:nitrilase [Thermosipho melanesiensis]|uniref:Nitrilase/cyanide hydratase and apolipoprotein N-acyltransferase n=2 Tax=Thermosipho melanesiensis TaxID=46541 RepID=A6LLW0_THEM4|nr:carbon-nitrogen hydrolase family protein [Thermosipho melanesiensis]ABR30911.1 Nitrilase/cyanide hydratase and apolipoprotein N-acyltransferase [Thermosipho melanesiensis BI429]APT74030.1 nitrilase [Thermosipho melanesiensis]OOC35957.1 nitrilase [Thermosipho melanesiensis]OOC38459.1 nitrilase [Thermosipho melanesiensis]OOC38920.1 nitrilase [Thermosipho melanesiensis]